MPMICLGLKETDPVEVIIPLEVSPHIDVWWCGGSHPVAAPFSKAVKGKY